MNFEDKINTLENDTLFLGLVFFIYVIAGDVIFEKPRAVFGYLKNNPVIRNLVIFSSAFLITQNMKYALVLLIGYTVLFDGLLDCDSVISILPEKCKKHIKETKAKK